MDRFLLHVFIGYSSDENERKILRLIRDEDAGTVQASNDTIVRKFTNSTSRLGTIYQQIERLEGGLGFEPM
jgi:hypothetical protein